NYPSALEAVNVRQPVARGDRLLDRPRSSCQEVSSLLSGLQQRELNARRESRHPRSRERKLHLVAARHPLPRGLGRDPHLLRRRGRRQDRKSTRLNSSHVAISYAVFCLKKKTIP